MTTETTPSTEGCVLELIGADVPSATPPRAAVLERVDWSVQCGEFWCVGGLHRSGKSDLLQLAAGLVPPLRGRRRLFGLEDLSRDHEARLRIGLMFDGGRLFQQLTVQENVALPVRYHRNRGEEEAAEQVEPVLELTQLAEFRRQLPARLGRNQQQRVGLARALTLRPELLLLDNPLSGLDPRDVVWWLRTLTELSKGHPLFNHKPMTILVTGDSFGPWKKTARRFAVLKDRQFHALKCWPEAGSEEAALVDHLQPLELQL